MDVRGDESVKPVKKRRCILKDDDVTIIDLEEMCERLDSWSDESTSLCIADFANREGIDPKTFHRWMDKHEKLRTAYELAVSKLGVRRETEALYNRLNPLLVLKTHAYYSNEVKEQMKWESGLRKQELAIGGSSNTPVIIMERYAATDAIPMAPSRLLGDSDERYSHNVNRSDEQFSKWNVAGKITQNAPDRVEVPSTSLADSSDSSDRGT